MLHIGKQEKINESLGMSIRFFWKQIPGNVIIILTQKSMQNSEICYILPSGSSEEYVDFIVFRTVDGAHSPFPIQILS